MIEIKQCQVCWGKKVICVGINDDLEPDKFRQCPGCNSLGWLAYKTVESKNTKLEEGG